MNKNTVHRLKEKRKKKPDGKIIVEDRFPFSVDLPIWHFRGTKK